METVTMETVTAHLTDRERYYLSLACDDMILYMAQRNKTTDDFICDLLQFRMAKKR